MIDPNSINVSELPSVSLDDRNLLPKSSIVYFAIDSQERIQYIGMTVRPKERWYDHHKRKQLEALGGVRIAYLEVKENLLRSTEETLINWFNPPLNKVRTYYRSSQESYEYCRIPRKPEAVATFRIDQQLWDDFKAWANESGSTASALMKKYIEECLNQAPNSELSKVKARLDALEREFAELKASCFEQRTEQPDQIS